MQQFSGQVSKDGITRVIVFSHECATSSGHGDGFTDLSGGMGTLLLRRNVPPLDSLFADMSDIVILRVVGRGYELRSVRNAR